MGNTITAYQTYFGKPDVMPDVFNPPTFDANLGFPSGRKERVMKATEAEMDAALLPQKYRDYCAHLALNYLRCRSEKYPWFVSCEHEKHDYDHCEYEDWVLRMKEYERERRLLERRKRKEQAAEREQGLVA